MILGKYKFLINIQSKLGKKYIKIIKEVKEDRCPSV